VNKGARLLEDAIISSDRASLCCLELFAVHTITNETSVPADSINKEPLTKVPDPFKGKETLVTHDIKFGYNESAIDTASYGYLNEMAAYLKANQGVRLEIAAHTDGIGSETFNKQLSQARADACVAYLVSAGADASMLTAKGFGACCPLEKEKTAEGKDIPAAREKNRRVEFTIIK
jgi:OOP family OmpA-OmpF porin